MANNGLCFYPAQYHFRLQKSQVFIVIHYLLFLFIFLVCVFILNKTILFYQVISLSFVIAILFFLHKKIIQQPNPVFEVLIIDNDGFYSFFSEKILTTKHKAKLTNNSKVSFLGCWLCFENKSTLFVFKDSFNEADFSQLSRIINQL